MHGASQGSTAGLREQRRRFVLILYTRAAVVAALLASTLLFRLWGGGAGFSATQVLLVGVALLVLLLSAGYRLWLPRLGNLGLHAQALIVLDVLVATVLVYVTGGVESPFAFFYALPIVHTAVFFPRRGTFLTAGLSCLLLSALFILENQKILPLELEGRVGSAPPAERVAYLLALNYIVFFAVAGLAGYLGEQLRRAGRELKKTESDLERLATLNRDIVLGLRSGLMVVDRREEVSLLNPVGEEILGLSRDQALRRPVAEVFPAIAPLLRRMRAEGRREFRREEVSHRRAPDQEPIPVGLTLSVLEGPGEEETGTLIHMQDLSEHKEMELLVKRNERMAALGALAAGIAHEIRNPLASISGAVQMLSNGASPGEQDRRLMEIVSRETERLDLLISDFLNYARPKEPQPRDCALRELMEDTVAVFRRSAGESETRVVCDLEAVRARVDPDQIRQVLWNLLRNAVQAMNGAGEVRVRLSAEAGGGALLEVLDSGPGVPAELRARIFEPFFTTREEGTGLGLALVARIVEAHQGTLELRCPQEGGSRFIVRLPGERS